MHEVITLGLPDFSDNAINKGQQLAVILADHYSQGIGGFYIPKIDIAVVLEASKKVMSSDVSEYDLVIKCRVHIPCKHHTQCTKRTLGLNNTDPGKLALKDIDHRPAPGYRH